MGVHATSCAPRADTTAAPILDLTGRLALSDAGVPGPWDRVYAVTTGGRLVEVRPVPVMEHTNHSGQQRRLYRLAGDDGQEYGAVTVVGLDGRS
jgi:hypothetical protein